MELQFLTRRQATFIASTVCELFLLTDMGLFIHQWDVRLRDLAKIYYVRTHTTTMHSPQLKYLKPLIFRT